MSDDSLLTVGGTCSILVGVTGALASLVYVILPPEQRLGVPAATILPSYAQDATLLNVEFLLLTLTGVFGLGAVPAITRLVRGQSEGWATWASALAMVGFAVQAVSNYFTFDRMPGIARAFVAGTEATRAALVPIWRSSFDLDGLWELGAIGAWVLVVSLLAWRGKAWPRNASYLGFAAGALYLLFVVGFLFKQPALFLIASIAGALTADVWYIWIGLIARRGQAAAAVSGRR